MSNKKINIAIAGFGNIGGYFYKTLEKNRKKIAIKTGIEPKIKYILANESSNYIYHYIFINSNIGNWLRFFR